MIMNIEPRVGLAFGDWLTDIVHFQSRRAFIGAQKFELADLAQAGETPFWTQKFISTK